LLIAEWGEFEALRGRGLSPNQQSAIGNQQFHRPMANG
jgi:hypothetical protein